MITGDVPSIDIIEGYTDPIIGDVYCNDAEEALAMARGTDGHAWVEFWRDGAAVSRAPLIQLEVVS